MFWKKRRQEKQKNLIKEALTEWVQSKEGETLIGTIVLKGTCQAFEQTLTKEVEVEDGKTEKGKIVYKKKFINILDELVYYLPGVEAAVRGCQSDAAQARDRAGQVRNAVHAVVKAVNPEIFEHLLEMEKHNIMKMLVTQNKDVIDMKPETDDS